MIHKCRYCGYPIEECECTEEMYDQEYNEGLKDALQELRFENERERYGEKED